MIFQHRKGSWLTCYSEENHLYHVQSGRNGRFKININYKSEQCLINYLQIHLFLFVSDIPTNQNGLYFVRSVLIRSNPAYSHFPGWLLLIFPNIEMLTTSFVIVDRVCDKHSAPGAPNQPIQPLPGESRNYIASSCHNNNISCS